MPIKLPHISIRRFGHVAVSLIVAAVCQYAMAFTPEFYRSSSVLSTGRWVKIAVPATGLYRLTPQRLKQMGFNDPSRVRVFGNGGARMSDIMTALYFKDDLSVVTTHRTESGAIVFYGVGPDQWTVSVTGRYVRSNNVYTTEGYYFVTEVGESDADSLYAEQPWTEIGRPGATNPMGTFMARLQHEQDLVSPGEAGPQLVGEDFRLTKSRTFTFNLTGLDTTSTAGDVWMETSFVAKTYRESSKLLLTVNGRTLPSVSTDNINATVNDGHYHGVESLSRRILSDIKDERMEVGLTHSSPVTVQGAWLNYIAINYPRRLEMPSTGVLDFWSNNVGLALSGVTAGTKVLDVTNAAIPQVVATGAPEGGKLIWTASFTGWRSYVAFNDDATFPEPEVRGVVANQDLHARLKSGNLPAMFIVGSKAMQPAARRIIELHAKDPVAPIAVEFVDIEQIYNEFGSGVADPTALRHFFKMAYDLGLDPSAGGNGSVFKYALLMGRATYDNRHLTEGVREFAGGYTIPNWTNATMRQSLNDTDGYNTDDVMAMLADGSGSDKGIDDLLIAIGRIPAITPNDANNYVDKLEQYMLSTKKTPWKSRVMMLADDADHGTHMNQTERMIGFMDETDGNPLFVNKLYIDAYTKVNNTYPMAREAMFRILDEGVVWWNYIGHANNHSLTHDGQLTYNDINTLYLKNYPVLYAATCDFLRWDANTISGGEIMFYERYGGAIAVISATRPVYIYENGLLNNAFGRHLGARDADGRMLTVGEIYRRSKNNILTDKGNHDSNTNRLRFVLMGDPAMRLAIPDSRIELTHIGDRPMTDLDDMTSEPVVLSALENTVARGRILSPDGTHDVSFNGTVTINLYDAEYSTTTHGYPSGDSEGTPVTFEQQGPRLMAASAPVVDGEFECAISVPVDITDNYRPAAITMYAYSANTPTEAAGKTNNLYVYGTTTSADRDTVSPSIDDLYLNHSTFVDGGTVNASPMLIAEVSDDVALNLSTAGIGHSMYIQIDGRMSLNDVSMYYTPASDGTPSGTIHYPLPDLTAGKHELMLRVWDTSANSATRTISFTVDASAAPRIYDIWTDANPAIDRANFYISHDRPDQMATVTVSVYNMLGHPLWSRTVTGVSDMFNSAPVTWDLTDNSGRRVPRGIYLYRATITTDGQVFDTGSRRIAVAGR